MYKLIVILFLSLYAGTSLATSETQKKLESVLKSELRPASDKARDNNRLPVQTMMFFGLKDTMKVMDLNPGSGYYVHILGQFLKEKGQFLVAVNTGNVEENILSQEFYQHIGVRSKKTITRREAGARYYSLKPLHLDETDLDMVTNFRSYHNYSGEDRANLNAHVFDALKPGGIYAVIDHTRRHLEPWTSENRRRIDPVLAIQEITSAGFEFVDFSPLHYRPDDALTLEVGHQSVTGQTDRWTLKFKKPE